MITLISVASRLHGFVGSSQGYGGKFWFWLRGRQSVLSRQINQEIECLSLMCLWAADKFGSFDLRFVGENPSRSSLQLFHSRYRTYSWARLKPNTIHDLGG